MKLRRAVAVALLLLLTVTGFCWADYAKRQSHLGLGAGLFDGFPYLLNDNFTTARTAGNVNGTAAVPGPGTRTVVDTENKLSISGGNLVFAGGKAVPAYGDPGLWYGPISRVLGKILLSSITTNAGNTMFGWDVNTSGGSTNGFQFINSEIDYFHGTGTKIGAYAPATAYKCCTILRGSGIYQFIKGGAFTDWTLLWISAVDNTATLYPAIINYSAASTFDFLRIPTTLWTPTPLSADWFGKDDCAWLTGAVGKLYPKGCNNNSLRDTDDASVLYQSDGYSNCGKTGSGVPFAKTTHNGQVCGVADLNGLMYEISLGITCIAASKTITGATQANPCVITIVGHGYTTGDIVLITSVGGMTQLNDKLYTITVIDPDTFSLDGVNSGAYGAFTSGGNCTKGAFYAAKQAAAMKDFTGGNALATDHWGATGVAAMMDPVSMPLVAASGGSALAQRFGSGANQVLSAAVSGNGWLLTGLGMPRDTSAFDATGTDTFGKDYFYQYIRNELCLISCASWSSSSTAGVWYCHLYYGRTGSADSVGWRCACYPTYTADLPSAIGKYGVGVCPTAGLPEGMVGITGYDIPGHDNYGNYLYRGESVCVFIPRHYYKYGTGSNGLVVNTVDIKGVDTYATTAAANADGYALHRAFIDGGQEQAGYFIFKYKASKVARGAGYVCASVQNGLPLSTYADHNPISGLTASGGTNAYYKAIDCAHAVDGENGAVNPSSIWFVASRFMESNLALWALSRQSATDMGTWPTTDGGGLTGLEAGGSGLTWGDFLSGGGTDGAGVTWDHEWNFSGVAAGGANLVDNPGTGKTALNLTAGDTNTPTTDWANRTNEAVLFDGGDYFTTAGNSDILSIAGAANKQFSILCELYFVESASTQWVYTTWDNTYTANHSSFGLYVGATGSNNLVSFNTCNGGGTVTNNTSSPKLVTGTHNQIIVSFDNGTTNIYVNGVLWSTATSQQIPQATTLNFQISGRTGGLLLANGNKISRVATLKGTALTAAQVRAEYNKWVATSDAGIYARMYGGPAPEGLTDQDGAVAAGVWGSEAAGEYGYQAYALRYHPTVDSTPGDYDNSTSFLRRTGTWSISGGAAVNAPVGTEKAINGDFTAWTGDNPDGWTVSSEDAGNYITENPAGKCQIVSDGTNVFMYQAPVPGNSWYRWSVDVDTVTSGGLQIYDSTQTTTITTTGTKVGVYRVIANTGIKRASPCNVTIDNVSLKQLPLSQLITSINRTGTPYVYASVKTTIATDFQGGIAFNLDDPNNPTNFNLCYLNTNDNKVYGDQCNKGTYTTIFASASVTPAAAAPITVRNISGSVYCWYNNAYVSSGTATPAGTYHGMFQTGSGAAETKLDDWFCYGVGVNGEYNRLNQFAN